MFNLKKSVTAKAVATAFSAILASTVFFTSEAHAAGKACTTKDGVTVANGARITLYYSSSPRQELGPNYTCAQVARARTCMNGFFSESQVLCGEPDSGGCAGSWLEQLADANFRYAICAD
jgi:uncharacterized membrane protein